MSSRAPEPLPSGRTGLDPEFVAASQRERLLDALVELSFEHGFAAVKIGDLTARARTAKRTFYVHFDGLDDAFIAAYDRIDHATFDALAQGAAQHTEPYPRIRGALRGLLDHLASHPAAANLWALESMAAAPRVAKRRLQTMHAFADLYISLHAQIADALRPAVPMSRIRALSVVGAVDQPLTTTLRESGAAAIPALEPDLSRSIYLLVYGTEPPAA